MNFKLLALITFSFTTVFVNCQNKELTPDSKGIKQPKVDIKVNKQYDDKGNVIGYDSTYSYTYSDSTNSQLNDNLLNKLYNSPNFQVHMFKNMPFDVDSLIKQNPFYNGFGFNDPFFNSDININSFDEMNKMLKRLDSLNIQNFHHMPLYQKQQKDPDKKPEDTKPQKQKPAPIPEPEDTTNVRIREI